MAAAREISDCCAKCRESLVNLTYPQQNPIEHQQVIPKKFSSRVIFLLRQHDVFVTVNTSQDAARQSAKPRPEAFGKSKGSQSLSWNRGVRKAAGAGRAFGCGPCRQPDAVRARRIGSSEMIGRCRGSLDLGQDQTPFGGNGSGRRQGVPLGTMRGPRLST